MREKEVCSAIKSGTELSQLKEQYASNTPGH